MLLIDNQSLSSFKKRQFYKQATPLNSFIFALQGFLLSSIVPITTSQGTQRRNKELRGKPKQKLFSNIKDNLISLHDQQYPLPY